MRHASGPIHITRRHLWLIVLSAVCWFGQPPLAGKADDRTQSIINCDIQTGPCTQKVGTHTVSLEIIPRPVTAMQDLIFKVTVEGPADHIQGPYIDLNMPAMDMGRNRVSLKHKGGGVFEGRGVIVRCVSRLKTWQAKITFPNLGRAYFIFDVVY